MIQESQKKPRKRKTPPVATDVVLLPRPPASNMTQQDDSGPMTPERHEAFAALTAQGPYGDDFISSL